jgi:ribonucleoside-diphosphate reductase alpha chain
VSGGIEPVFGLVHSRRTYDNNLYYVVNDVFKKTLEERYIYSDELMKKIEENHGSCQGIKDIPEDLQKIFITAHDILPKEHVKMLSAIQKHVDLSISKTINFNNSATEEDIKDIVLYGWKNGCRGLAVYRDGSRENQTLSTSKEESNKQKESLFIFDTIDPIEKDDLGETYGTSIKKRVACGNLFIQLFRDGSGNLAEMFINTSKSGICQSNINAISRLVSIGLRSGIKVEYLCDQLIGIKCPACTVLKSKGEKVESSCAEAIGKYIMDKYKQGTVTIKEHKVKSKNNKTIKKEDKNKCPNCGEKLRMESGCIICNCGFSKCG